jgi:hypothetical protein
MVLTKGKLWKTNMTNQNATASTRKASSMRMHDLTSKWIEQNRRGDLIYISLLFQRCFKNPIKNELDPTHSKY